MVIDVHIPIKDQGIVKSPVRIGPDTWVAAKVTVLRETRVGRGCVLGAHAVVKGDIPDYSIAVGAPAKVVKNRKLAWEADAVGAPKLRPSMGARRSSNSRSICRRKAEKGSRS